jgi:hypothetical protein
MMLTLNAAGMVVLEGLSFCEGLIALLRDNYYVVVPSGFLLFDVTGWGWIMLLWGILLACIGLALLASTRGSPVPHCARTSRS